MSEDSAARQGVGTCAVCGGWPRHLATLNPCRCTAVIEPSDSAARQVNAQATKELEAALREYDLEEGWGTTEEWIAGLMALVNRFRAVVAASVPAPAPSTEPLLYELTQALILKKWPLRPDPEDIAQMMEGLLLEPYGGAHCVLCGGRINCADCRPSVPSGHEDGCRMPEFLKFYWPERNAALAPAPSEAPQKEDCMIDELKQAATLKHGQDAGDTIAGLSMEIRNLAHRGWEDRPNAEYLFRTIGQKAFQISNIVGAPSEAKPTTELKSEQAEEEFYKWWQPKTLIGGRFHGYSENWGAKDAWVAARSEPPAEASREGK